jgi:hypothetical protein
LRQIAQYKIDRTGKKISNQYLLATLPAPVNPKFKAIVFGKK